LKEKAKKATKNGQKASWPQGASLAASHARGQQVLAASLRLAASKRWPLACGQQAARPRGQQALAAALRPTGRKALRPAGLLAASSGQWPAARPCGPQALAAGPAAASRP